MPPLVLPPTSAYPRDPTALERERLDALYLELRGKYKSLMISRGIHRSRSQKQGGLLRELSQRLRALAMREASVKAEAYAILEIVTDVVEHLEDAGDEMGTAFGAYQLGRHSYNGGGNIGRLVQAVINFLNRWRQSKQRFEQLSARQEALRANLRELDGGMPLMVQTEPRVAGELAEGLERLGVKKLKALCKERGFKGYTGTPASPRQL